MYPFAPEHRARPRLRQPVAPKVAVLLNANAKRVNEKVRRTLSHVVPERTSSSPAPRGGAAGIAETVVDRRYQTVFTGGGDGTFVSWVNRDHRAPPSAARLARAPLRRAEAGHRQRAWPRWSAPPRPPRPGPRRASRPARGPRAPPARPAHLRGAPDPVRRRGPRRRHPQRLRLARRTAWRHAAASPGARRAPATASRWPSAPRPLPAGAPPRLMRDRQRRPRRLAARRPAGAASARPSAPARCSTPAPHDGGAPHRPLLRLRPPALPLRRAGAAA